MQNIDRAHESCLETDEINDKCLLIYKLGLCWILKDEQTSRMIIDEMYVEDAKKVHFRPLCPVAAQSREMAA